MDRVWALLAAPFVGSLLGVLIRRLPRGEPVGLDRSRCEACGTPLAARDLVPVLSYTWLRGRCRHCGTGIAAFHWQIELAATLAPLGAICAGEEGGALWALCGLGWTLLALGWIDAEHMLIPDVLSLPLLLAGLLDAWMFAPAALADRALAAGLGWLSLEAIAWLYRRLRGRDGLGAGDAKLLGALGAWAGISALPLILFGGAICALTYAAVRHVRGEALAATTALPFGPFLALAGWIVVLS